MEKQKELPGAWLAALDGRTAVIDQMVQIRKQLDVQIALADNDRQNWVYSEEAEHISHLLGEIQQFLAHYNQHINKL